MKLNINNKVYLSDLRKMSIYEIQDLISELVKEIGRLERCL